MVGIFDSRTVLTVDDNNNETVTTRRGISPATKKILVVLLSLGLVGSVAAISVAATGSSDNSGAGSVSVSEYGSGSGSRVGSPQGIVQGDPGEFRMNRRNLERGWGPLLLSMKPAKSDVNKLEEIRRLSPFPAPKAPREDVCYTTECLDASLNLLRSMNFSVDPCENFFQYSCGRWLAENPIPSTSSRWSQFNILRDMVNNVTQGILTAPEDPADFKPITQTKKYYKQCIDLAKLNARGLQPVLDIVNTYGGWPAASTNWDASKFNVVQTIGEYRRQFLDSVIVQVYPSLDWKNTTRSVIYLDQGPFFLSRSVLLNPTDYASRIKAYEDYFVGVATAFATANGATPVETELRKQAQDVIAFESTLASYSAADENRTIVDRVYNPRKLNAYESTENKFPWRSLLDTIFKTSGVTIRDDEDLVVLEGEYLNKTKELLDSANPATVANYIQWRLVSGLISETTDEMRDLAFRFSAANGGSQTPPSRDTNCASTALNSFGMAIGVKYIAEAFNIDAKANVDLMVNNLRTAFLELLEEATWMDEETKINARKKANSMRQFMAFPEWLFNQTRLESEYAGYELDPTNWLESVIGMSTWGGDHNLNTLRDIVDKDYWLTYPGVVNAFYSPEYNSITFPAGILAPPFYRSNGPESLNYGGIGVVIGHEITHGFDDQGSQYDADGNAVNWWSEEILTRFLEKAQCIIDQYGDFEVTVTGNRTLNVNGDLTSGENIADNGGVRQSFQAYRNWVRNNNGGKEELRLPGLEDISPDQLFFLGYANIWCENINEGALENQILGDPHSPARFRVLGPLQNSVIFAEKWSCPSGSPMNPSNQPKCVLW